MALALGVYEDSQNNPNNEISSIITSIKKVAQYTRINEI